MSSGLTFLPPVNDRAGSPAGSKRQKAQSTVAVERSTRRLSIFNGLEPEHRLGIGLEKGLLVCIAEWHAFHGRHFLGNILIGIVHRVEHAIAPDDRASEHDCRLPRHTAGRVVHILTHLVADSSLEWLETFIALGDLSPMHEIKPKVPERQSLSEMT